jgi:hypothetical protein
MSGSTGNKGGLSKYSRMTPAKKPEIHVTHTCSSLKWMTEQSNTSDGETCDLPLTHN